MSELAPIFIAASVAEIDFVEKLLEAEGIEYEVRPEAFVQEPLSGACMQGVMFEVMTGQAAYCRKLLAQRGLARGVIED